MPLLIVPTPIGNLGDMTFRGLEALRSAEVIACEDTRRTLKLLNHHGIRRPLLSCHRHNERERAREIISRLERGETVAVVSDAGTPGISDPGHILINEAIARGLDVDVLPGANAVLPALLLSGLSARRFCFAGFVDGSASEMVSSLESLAGLDATLIFYSAPHDLAKFLASCEKAFGGARRAAVVREVSKVHQETIRGTIAEISRACREREIKGEMAVVVEGAGGADAAGEDDKWKTLALGMKRAGMSDRDIASLLAETCGVGKNEVKEALLRNR
jgi:16S rRNA (cytidine1402-2'-O)-methyltransferase